MKTTIKSITAIAFFGFALTMTSCNKLENGEVIEDTYTGNIMVTSGGQDPAGDFTGDGDSGTKKWAWNNPKTKASLNFDITTNTGSVQFILEDKKGDEVLNQTLTSNGEDTYSGVSSEGKEGTWTVTMILTNFNGDGSYSIHPGN